MAKFQVAPTKTNLLSMKQNQKFASEGHDLLDQKREIIVAELMGMVATAAEISENVDKLFSQAYKELDKAIVILGKNKLQEISKIINIEPKVSLSARRVMGIALPVVDVFVSEKKPYYGFLDTDAALDEAVAKFRQILDLLAKLAQTKISVYRLAKEAQKTTRRVNALEKIYLPDYEETISYINNVLEESERESFFVLKLIKKRLSKKQ